MAATVIGRGESIQLPTSGTFALNITPATGNWMLAIFTSENKADLSRFPTPPAGWTVIREFSTVGTGTMGFGVYAKVYGGNASELEWTNTYAAGLNHTRVVTVYGTGPAISSWDIGSFGVREENASSTTAKSPAMGARRAGLAILVAGERTVATETDEQITVDNGFTKMFTDMSFSAITTVATKTTPAGAIGASVVTYPNTHNFNGIAGVIVIPNDANATPINPVVGIPVKINGSSGWATHLAQPKVMTASGWKAATLKRWNGTSWTTAQ